MSLFLLAMQWGGGDGYGPVDPSVNPPPTQDYALCRFVFERDRNEAAGSGWRTDYPLAEMNLMIRLGEMTTVRVAKNDTGGPAHRLTTSDRIDHCPMLLGSDMGTMALTEIQAKHLRDYLLKGGFLWSDDTWGTLSWEQLGREFGKVFPRFRMVEVPTDHEIYSQYYWIEGGTAQMPNNGFWATAKKTSERGEDSAVPVTAAIYDDYGRMMVLITHNTDIGDSWEREGDPVFFTTFAVPGYSLGINVVLYALTH